MAKVMDTSQWIAFFRKSGLPANVAANYAIIFFDNRIQVDMLLDLSKEYLYDMGIKVMGDVIAILKYAKEFHNQLAKERIIGAPVTAVPKAKAVAERFVGHYTRSSPVRPVPIRSVNAPIRSVNAPIRSVTAPMERGLQRKPNVISLKKNTNLESPFRKPRRVPPEEEGAYRIKMPQGTTERTRKILQLQQKKSVQGLKRSVFSRLGESAVSSSTDSDKVQSSVFERLGPSNKSDEIPSSTVVNEFEAARPHGPPLPYRGVLKMTVGKNRTVTTTIPKNANITSRTVIKPSNFGNQRVVQSIQLNNINKVLKTNAPVHTSNLRKNIGGQGLFGKAIAAQGQNNIKSRLGGKLDTKNLARTKIMLKRGPIKSQSNVFDRLGSGRKKITFDLK